MFASIASKLFQEINTNLTKAQQEKSFLTNTATILSDQKE